MKRMGGVIIQVFIFFSLFGHQGYLVNNVFAGEGDMGKENKIIFLHHSTGLHVIKGDVNKLSYKLFKKGSFDKWMEQYNKKKNTQYNVTHRSFPKKEPYGWNNYPFDYYNIWVKNAGKKPYKEEPTLEILTKDYNTIIWKHCFPVSWIKETGKPGDIDSSKRTLENYKLQYNALKEKMHSFPDTTFIVWTGAALTKKMTSEDAAKRMQKFVDWVINDWDEKGDNIFLWDFYGLETEGGLYLKEQYAVGPEDAHPNKEFSSRVAPYFGQRIVDILEGRGDSSSLTGK